MSFGHQMSSDQAERDIESRGGNEKEDILADARDPPVVRIDAQMCPCWWLHFINRQDHYSAQGDEESKGRIFNHLE
jgi:hypothetical protein